MTIRNDPVPALSAIVFTTGCYSSYSISAVALAVKDLDLTSLREQYHSEVSPLGRSQSPFVAWLEKHGYVKETSYFEAQDDDDMFDVREVKV